MSSSPPGGGATRDVRPGSRVEAILRHAGLTPAEVPTGPDGGRYVTEAEALAEIDRRGLQVSVPETLPPLTEKAARRYVRKLHSLGAHILLLHEGTKAPVASAWQEAPPATEDEAVAWLAGGGNLGILCSGSGRNGWLVLDAENGPATALLAAAGLVPAAITANAQDPSNPKKLGGSHFWFPLPDDVDPATLTTRLVVPLPGGGTVDVMVGPRNIVAPGSRLDGAPGLRYEFAEAGAAFHPELWGAHDIRWLFDPDAPAPDVEGIEILRGCARKVEKVRRPRSAEGDELTDNLDAIGWEEWIAGDPRVEIIGTDGRCGCEVFHFDGASEPRSGIIHDGCEYGYGMHIFSGTLQGLLGTDHCSRLQFATFLRGLPPERCAEVARSMGVEMGRKPLSGWSAEDLAELRAAEAHEARSAGAAQEAATDTVVTVLPVTVPPAPTAAVPPAPPRLTAVPPIGSVSGAPMIGSVSGTPPAPGGGSVPPGPAPYVHGAAAPAVALHLVEDTPETVLADPLAAAEAKAEELFAKADDPELMDKIFTKSELLEEIRRRAEVSQVSPMVALSANVNAILSVIPFDVVLPKVVGKKRAPLNLITVPVDESGGGKGGITAYDIDPVSAQSCATLPAGFSGVATVPTPLQVGSGEAISAAYSTITKDKDTGAFTSENHVTSNWFSWDEVTKILAVRDRKSSTIEAELSSGFSGERLGSQTKTNPAWTDAMSYRFVATIAAQRTTATGLFTNETQGILQRIWWVSAAYRISEEDADPVKLAEGRRSPDGQWFAEPQGTEQPIPVKLPVWPANRLIPVAADVASEIEVARAAHGRGRKAHPWRRHELQIRLRLATAGAAMHSQCGVTLDWWEWAGWLMEHSNYVRDGVHALSGYDDAKIAAAAGKADAVRADVRDASRWRSAVEATEKWAKKRGGRFTLKQAKEVSRKSYRAEVMPDILKALVEAGRLSADSVFMPQAGADVTFYWHVDLES